MRVGMFIAGKVPEGADEYEAHLVKKYDTPVRKALMQGIAARQDVPVKANISDLNGLDVGIIWGVKSRKKFMALREYGIPTVVIDKGYVLGRSSSFKVTVNGTGPGKYFMKHKRSNKRWRQLRWSVIDRTRIPGRGEAIYLVLSSQKYANWYNLGNASDYAAKLVDKIKRVTDRPIIYRPKPSWVRKLSREDFELPYVEMSTDNGGFMRDLTRSWITVTHGSGAAVTSVLMGIPAISLSQEAAAFPVSGHEITEDSLSNPFWPSVGERQQWANNLAYTQWTLDEMQSGEAWKHIKEDIEVAV